MKKLLLYILLFSASLLVNAQSIAKCNRKVDSLSIVMSKQNLSLENIEFKVDMLNDCYKKQGELITQSNEVINTTLESGNRSYNMFTLAFTVFAAILSVCGIFLARYINRKEKSVRCMLTAVKQEKKVVNDEMNEMQKELNRIKETREEVEKVNQQINNDMASIYEKLKREETVSLLDRLIQIPCDIANVNTLLLSRELIEEDYNRLLSAYNVLVENNEHDMECGFSTFGDDYLLIFFQHFLDISINEPVLKDKIISFFNIGCRSAFKNDIEKSTKDLLKGISKWGDEEKVEVLVLYIKSLVNYRKDNMFVYEIIINELNNKELIEKIWDKLILEEWANDNFTKALQSKYQDDILFVDKITSDIQVLNATKKKQKEQQQQQLNKK